ncbi:MAG: tRNA 2-thiouridine(34) synthase MnmA [Thermodesulforhabdaceae bacterium]|jgi:tRNA-specific 2-thiouridylase
MSKGVVAVAMSGGMDSLRAAVLLKKEGYDVVGLFMTLSDHMSQVNLIDRLDILEEKFQIPIHKVEAIEVFEKTVIEPFVNAYLGGETPNPCVVCNPSIKFGFLLDYWKSRAGEICSSLGISSIPLSLLATGHYVSLVSPDENPYGLRYGIRRHKDDSKDQSYFLYGLSQEQLRQAIFPLASETKKEVALWVSSLGLQDLVVSESQEICFIPSRDYAGFLEKRVPWLAGSSGPIKDLTGRVLGYHKGIHRYTIGQRRGIGIPSSAPYYVVKISPEENTVYVGRRNELAAYGCFVRDVKWVSTECPDRKFRASVKIRNQHKPAAATVEPLSEDRAIIRFDVPQDAVTPGQSAVFYEGEWLLGGGVISGSINSFEE